MSSILIFKYKIILYINREQPSPTKSLSMITCKYFTNIFPPCFRFRDLFIFAISILFISRFLSSFLLQSING